MLPTVSVYYVRTPIGGEIGNWIKPNDRARNETFEGDGYGLWKH